MKSLHLLFFLLDYSSLSSPCPPLNIVYSLMSMKSLLISKKCCFSSSILINLVGLVVNDHYCYVRDENMNSRVIPSVFLYCDTYLYQNTAAAIKPKIPIKLHVPTITKRNLIEQNRSNLIKSFICWWKLTEK